MVKLNLAVEDIAVLTDDDIALVSGGDGTLGCSSGCVNTCDSSTCVTNTGASCKPTSNGCICPAPGTNNK